MFFFTVFVFHFSLFLISFFPLIVFTRILVVRERFNKAWYRMIVSLGRVFGWMLPVLIAG